MCVCECVYTYYDESLEGYWYAGEVLKVSIWSVYISWVYYISWSIVWSIYISWVYLCM